MKTLLLQLLWMLTLKNEPSTLNTEKIFSSLLDKISNRQ